MTAIVLLILTLALAGLVKGLAGLGFSLVATPILASVFGPRRAIVIGSIPGLVLNVLLLVEGRRWLLVFRELWLLAATGASGVVCGLLLFVRLNPSALRLAIALLTLLSLALGSRLRRWGGAGTQAVGLVIAGVSGVLSGSTSIDGPLLAAYFYARRWEPGRFVVALTLVFQVFTAVQVVGFWHLGLYDATTLAPGLLGLVPTVATFRIGQRIRERIPVGRFRRLVAGFLVIASLNLMVQALGTEWPAR